MDQKSDVNTKYFLKVREAAEYYGFGVKKMRRIAENGLGKFSVRNGSNFLIARNKFEEYMDKVMFSGTPYCFGPDGEDEDLTSSTPDSSVWDGSDESLNS